MTITMAVLPCELVAEVVAWLPSWCLLSRGGGGTGDTYNTLCRRQLLVSSVYQSYLSVRHTTLLRRLANEELKKASATHYNYPFAMASQQIRVVITCATTPIGRLLAYEVATGHVFGDTTPLVLHLLEDTGEKWPKITELKNELRNLASPILSNVETFVLKVTGWEPALKDVDFAFLLDSQREDGMTENEYIGTNAKQYKRIGSEIGKNAPNNIHALVVGEPVNTNAFVASTYASGIGGIPVKNFTALIQDDHNRLKSQLAMKLGVGVRDIQNVVVWGNHSSEQLLDLSNARIRLPNRQIQNVSTILNEGWIMNEYISRYRMDRDRDQDLTFSSVKGITDQVKLWRSELANTSMCGPSDGSYNVMQGLFFSFPVKIELMEYKIVQNIELSQQDREKLTQNAATLMRERDVALNACSQE